MGKGEHIRAQAAPAPEAPKHRKKSTGNKWCAKNPGKPCEFGPWEHGAPRSEYSAPELIRHCVKCRKKQEEHLWRWTYVNHVRQECLAPGYGSVDWWRWN